MGIKYEVNHHLLELRIAKKYGQKDKFLKDLGITRQAWNYKINAPAVSIRSIVAICNLLEITENQFKNYFLTKDE